MGDKLDFTAIDALGTSGEIASTDSWRRRRREINPTVQMSVRMPETTYEKFRILCQRERRTNGDMLAVLMESYLSEERKRDRER